MLYSKCLDDWMELDSSCVWRSASAFPEILFLCGAQHQTMEWLLLIFAKCCLTCCVVHFVFTTYNVKSANLWRGPQDKEIVRDEVRNTKALLDSRINGIEAQQKGCNKTSEEATSSINALTARVAGLMEQGGSVDYKLDQAAKQIHVFRKDQETLQTKVHNLGTEIRSECTVFACGLRLLCLCFRRRTPKVLKPCVQIFGVQDVMLTRIIRFPR